MSPQTSVNVLWGVWYVTWIAAGVWSGKTKIQMKTDIRALYRVFLVVGVILLFWPSVQRGAAEAIGPGAFFERLWPRSVPTEWSLFALTVLGFAFCWWARLHLGKLWSGFVTLKEDHRIVDTGPYGLVRHPIYSGVMFAALTTALMRASPAALTGFMLFAGGSYMTAKVEERFLSDALGAVPYNDYRRRIGMLVPRLSPVSKLR